MIQPVTIIHDTIPAQIAEGLGISLYVAKQIADRNGWTLEGMSEGEGRGTTFTLTLPMRS